ncbi:MAG TPA: 50S ribosomal protein L24 [Thermoplasmata archaeon]|nr:50S ribosomal protein L24 [Thermoplasmata archaeon]
MVSTRPRTQRKRLYEANIGRRHRLLGAHVDPDLAGKSKLQLPRALPVREGDVVRIMRGSFRGKEGKIVSVDSKRGLAVIEGITIEKTDEKKVPRPIHASNLMIIKLDDTDPWRRKKYEE